MVIEIYSKTNCPYCVKSKEYLQQNDISYVETLFDDAEDRQHMYDTLGLDSDKRTVPQILLVENDGRRIRIGGYTDLIHSDIIGRRNVVFNTEF